jgi:enoyl-CoA hydratase/carnithine racemase
LISLGSDPTCCEILADRNRGHQGKGLIVSDSSGLVAETEAGVVTLWLDRPGRRNALSESLLTQLEEALEAIASDSSTRVVVIAAKGPVFSSGHDLSEMVDRSEQDYADLFGRCSRVMQKLRILPQPVIARVQGPALAAGCQLVASCDLAVAADSATFSTPGVKIGLFCTTPMIPLVRAIPPKAAMEMLVTGEAIDAARALALGLINRVVPTDGLDAVVSEWAEAIKASSPMVIRIGKAAFYDQLALDEPSAYLRGTAVMVDNATRLDAQEGIGAFLAKRRPIWSGS